MGVCGFLIGDLWFPTIIIFSVFTVGGVCGLVAVMSKSFETTNSTEESNVEVHEVVENYERLQEPPQNLNPKQTAIFPAWVCCLPIAVWAFLAIPSCNKKSSDYKHAIRVYEKAYEKHENYLDAISPTVYETATGVTYHTHSHYPYQSEAIKLHRAQRYLSPCLNCRPPAPRNFPEFTKKRPSKKSAILEFLSFFPTIFLVGWLFVKRAGGAENNQPAGQSGGDQPPTHSEV